MPFWDYSQLRNTPCFTQVVCRRWPPMVSGEADQVKDQGLLKCKTTNYFPFLACYVALLCSKLQWVASTQTLSPARFDRNYMGAAMRAAEAKRIP
jgi:hypothetical protein